MVTTLKPTITVALLLLVLGSRFIGLRFICKNILICGGDSIAIFADVFPSLVLKPLSTSISITRGYQSRRPGSNYSFLPSKAGRDLAVEPSP